MRKHVLRHPWRRLLPLAAVLLGAAVGLALLQRADRTAVYELQVQAAQRVVEAYEAISARAQEAGLRIDEDNDPNRTGIIGTSFSSITTTAGHLPAKRTSTNPDFAAYLVRVLAQHASPAGGPVVIALSGSFPALGVAAIVSCEELGLDVALLSSVGSSSFGANHPELTWLDMEEALAESSVIHTRTLLASLGGSEDIGVFLVEEGHEAAREAIVRTGVPALVENSFGAQLSGKLSLLERLSPQLLINIGGNATHIGPGGYRLPAGVVNQPPADVSELGLVGWCLERGITVVHLLDIMDLALRHGLAIDPVPLPAPGRSAVYYEGAVPLAWPASALLTAVTLYLIGLGALRARERRNK